jgi:hypothetical protein
MGVKTAKQATNKNLEILFDLDADALSFATVHGHHLKKSAKMMIVREHPPQPFPVRLFCHA